MSHFEVCREIANESHLTVHAWESDEYGRGYYDRPMLSGSTNVMKKGQAEDVPELVNVGQQDTQIAPYFYHLNARHFVQRCNTLKGVHTKLDYDVFQYVSHEAFRIVSFVDGAESQRYAPKLTSTTGLDDLHVGHGYYRYGDEDMGLYGPFRQKQDAPNLLVNFRPAHAIAANSYIVEDSTERDATVEVKVGEREIPRTFLEKLTGKVAVVEPIYDSVDRHYREIFEIWSPETSPITVEEAGISAGSDSVTSVRIKTLGGRSIDGISIYTATEMAGELYERIIAEGPIVIDSLMRYLRNDRICVNRGGGDIYADKTRRAAEVNYQDRDGGVNVDVVASTLM